MREEKRVGGSRERRRIGIWDNGGRQGGRGKCAGCQAGRPIGLLWAYLRLPNQALPQYQPGIFPPGRGMLHQGEGCNTRERDVTPGRGM